jgi:hypothetical protein
MTLPLHEIADLARISRKGFPLIEALRWLQGLTIDQQLLVLGLLIVAFVVVVRELLVH